MKVITHIYGTNAMDQTLEVEATELTKHFCIAHIPETKFTFKGDSFTHIPTGWRIGNHFAHTKEEALVKAEALEKLDVDWSKTDINYYEEFPEEILDEVRTIMIGMAIG